MKLVSLAVDLTKEQTDAVVALTLAVAKTRELGLVATVELEPGFPPAMGHYSPTVTVRRAIDHNLEAAKRGGYAK